jgi:hypothetical protein
MPDNPEAKILRDQDQPPVTENAHENAQNNPETNRNWRTPKTIFKKIANELFPILTGLGTATIHVYFSQNNPEDINEKLSEFGAQIASSFLATKTLEFTAGFLQKRFSQQALTERETALASRAIGLFAGSYVADSIRNLNDGLLSSGIDSDPSYSIGNYAGFLLTMYRNSNSRNPSRSIANAPLLENNDTQELTPPATNTFNAGERAIEISSSVVMGPSRTITQEGDQPATISPENKARIMEILYPTPSSTNQSGLPSQHQAQGMQSIKEGASPREILRPNPVNLFRANRVIPGPQAGTYLDSLTSIGSAFQPVNGIGGRGESNNTHQSPEAKSAMLKPIIGTNTKQESPSIEDTASQPLSNASRQPFIIVPQNPALKVSQPSRPFSSTTQGASRPFVIAPQNPPLIASQVSQASVPATQIRLARSVSPIANEKIGAEVAL